MPDLIDFRELHWMNQPQYYILNEDKLILETNPHTSFHALRFDMTKAHGMVLDPMQQFVLTVRVDYSFLREGDECGILIRHDNGKWAKACIEYHQETLDLACVVYGNGFGDRSTRQLGSSIRWMYFRVMYWNGNARFQYSFNGEKYSDMRWLHMASSKDTVVAGIYACSPANEGFDCTFSKMFVHQI